MSELKPCPFCGSKAELRDLTNRANYAVCCTNKECRVSTIHTIYNWHTEEDAIKAWNTRKRAKKRALESVREVLASVRETKEDKERLVALYTWLNDMRLGIAPDENTPEDERGERQAQVDVIDQIMEWMEENGV